MRLSHTLGGITLALGVTFAFAPAARAEVDKKIERVWKSKCASCHGADGKGATEQGGKMKIADYTTAAFQKATTDDKIKDAILKGVKREADGVKKEMDPYNDLKPEQIDGLVALIRSFAK